MTQLQVDNLGFILLKKNPNHFPAMLSWIILAALDVLLLVNGQGPTNCQIVNTIYQSLGGSVNSTDCCLSIPGVTCFGDQVTKLSWSDSLLLGPFPTDFSLLTELTEL
jgi:hypothetical protein